MELEFSTNFDIFEINNLALEFNIMAIKSDMGRNLF